MGRGYAVDAVRSARGDATRVRLEGVHALKHALRFGADVLAIVTPDADALRRLLEQLAPDVDLPVDLEVVDAGTWGALTGRELPSPCLAVAERPSVRPDDVVAAPGRIVLLERPRHLGNLGAVVRVAAAAGAGGVLVVGDADPWHPTAVRAAAGLQFATRVARVATIEELPAIDRAIVAVDPAGEPLGGGVVPDDVLLAIGTERGGLSSSLRARATSTVGIPMQPGVSSLNLATAVAVLLYAA